MTSSFGLYGESLGLLTDLYQLTMAYGYWKLGMADREAVFHVSRSAKATLQQRVYYGLRPGGGCRLRPRSCPFAG